MKLKNSKSRYLLKRIFKYILFWKSLNFQFKFFLTFQTMKISKDLEKLFDDYEGNLLNYFAGLSPKESKTFNKLIKDSKENNKKWF
mgnify:CR=1 FL=1